MQNKAIKTYIDGKKISRIVDCPAFTNQPTISEVELNSTFKSWNVNYYYVHIVDSSAGTFKLMTAHNDATSCIEQTFTLSKLNTGNSGILKENSIVDFLTVGENWQMRSAGVSELALKNLNSNKINININGFSDINGFFHVMYIDNMVTSDFLCAGSSLNVIYGGADGLVFGNLSKRKNLLISSDLNIKINKNYIDFSGIHMYKKLVESDKTKVELNGGECVPIKGIFYKKDLSALPNNNINNFMLKADGLFLNGTEIVAVGKERF